MAKSSYTKVGLMQMKVVEIRQLVRKHNLHYVIKGYSKLRKSDLADAFLDKMSELGTTKVTKKTKSVKLTQLEKDIGIGKPLYEEGLKRGAKKQFEKRYGKMDKNEKKKEKKQEEEETGRGKRKRRLPKRFR